MECSGKEIEKMAREIVEAAGFYTRWTEYSSTFGVDDRECSERCFLGYGLKIVENDWGLCLKYQGGLVCNFHFRSKDYSKKFNSDWVEILYLIYGKINVLSEVLKLCED